jgi:hypothetical protein
MHKLSTNFVLGYHGCRKAVADHLIAGSDFVVSQNDYDWLGSGIYFWLSDPDRAIDFMREKFKREGISEAPAVVGAIIDMGLCLDLSTISGVKAVSDAYRGFIRTVRLAGDRMPENSGGTDLLRRHLDCAVINYLHFVRDEAAVPSIDTVRGIFQEGKPAFPNAGFREKTHTQIAVRNPDCIKGVFRPH